MQAGRTWEHKVHEGVSWMWHIHSPRKENNKKSCSFIHFEVGCLWVCEASLLLTKLRAWCTTVTLIIYYTDTKNYSIWSVSQCSTLLSNDIWFCSHMVFGVCLVNVHHTQHQSHLMHQPYSTEATPTYTNTGSSTHAHTHMHTHTCTGSTTQCGFLQRQRCYLGSFKWFHTLDKHKSHMYVVVISPSHSLHLIPHHKK